MTSSTKPTLTSSLANPSPDPPIALSTCQTSSITFRRKTCFHLPPSSRSSSSSSSTAWPLLTTRCFWETGSTSSSSRFLTPIYFYPYTRHSGPPALHRDAHRACTLQAVYPAARVGKITGMLLEQDIDQIVPLFFFPEMVRSNSPSSSPAVACTRPTRPVARGAAAAGENQGGASSA